MIAALCFHGGWRTPPICPLVAQCTNPREAIMGANARWAVPMSMINIHDKLTCYVIPQRHTDVGRCLASVNTDARDFANQNYICLHIIQIVFHRFHNLFSNSAKLIKFHMATF